MKTVKNEVLFLNWKKLDIGVHMATVACYYLGNAVPTGVLSPTFHRHWSHMLLASSALSKMAIDWGLFIYCCFACKIRGE
jgi:hypothetical protein